LAEVGYDPEFDAHPFKRAIQRDFHEGDVIRVDRGGDGLVFSSTMREEVVDL